MDDPKIFSKRKEFVGFFVDGDMMAANGYLLLTKNGHLILECTAQVLVPGEQAQKKFKQSDEKIKKENRHNLGFFQKIISFLAK
jgi:hypothetical protein